MRLSLSLLPCACIREYVLIGACIAYVEELEKSENTHM